MNPGSSVWGKVQLSICPLLASLPIGIELLTKLAPSRNLLLGYGGLLGGQKPGASFAGYRLSQADVRAMASFRIFVASAAGLATAATG